MKAPEQKIQMSIVSWFDFNYPNLEGLLCHNLNNSSSKRQGIKNMLLGTFKGRSDLELLFRGKLYLIELKTLTGRQSDSQKDWQALVESQGFDYFLIRSLEEFQTLIVSICGPATVIPNQDIFKSDIV